MDQRKYRSEATWRVPFSQEVWDRLAAIGEESPAKEGIAAWINLGPAYEHPEAPLAHSYLDAFARREGEEIFLSLLRMPAAEGEGSEVADSDLKRSQKFGGKAGFATQMRAFLQEVGSVSAQLEVAVRVEKSTDVECPIFSDVQLLAGALAGELGETCTLNGLSMEITNGVDGLRNFAILTTPRPETGWTLLITAKTTLEISEEGEIPACARLINAVIGKICKTRGRNG